MAETIGTVIWASVAIIYPGTDTAPTVRLDGIEPSDLSKPLHTWRILATTVAWDPAWGEPVLSENYVITAETDGPEATITFYTGDPLRERTQTCPHVHLRRFTDIERMTLAEAFERSSHPASSREEQTND